MKIAYIYGSMTHHDLGLANLLRFTRDIFAELGIDIDEINLGSLKLPPPDGTRQSAAEGVMARLREASGFVFASTVSLFAPSSIMQTFLEHLIENKELLAGKHCFNIMISQQGGERSALEYLARVQEHMGAYPCSRLGLMQQNISRLSTDEELRLSVEKESEDFYRALRQNRRYVIPRDIGQSPSIMDMPIIPASSAVASSNDDAARRLKLDAFTQEQEQDIEEISRLFEAKYNGNGGGDDLLNSGRSLLGNPSGGFGTAGNSGLANGTSGTFGGASSIATNNSGFGNNANPPAAYGNNTNGGFGGAIGNGGNTFAAAAHSNPPRPKTTRQITQSLPHYFQPHLAGDTSCVIQINVTGAEPFDGYLQIANKECSYFEGITQNPDLTLIADSAVWGRVITGKHTVRGAFTMGGVRTSGNFMLLTQFDTLFKLG